MGTLLAAQKVSIGKRSSEKRDLRRSLVMFSRVKQVTSTHVHLTPSSLPQAYASRTWTGRIQNLYYRYILNQDSWYRNQKHESRHEFTNSSRSQHRPIAFLLKPLNDHRASDFASDKQNLTESDFSSDSDGHVIGKLRSIELTIGLTVKSLIQCSIHEGTVILNIYCQ